MALANIAVLLAQRGRRVLMIDWDLEAPGLEKYFNNFTIQPSSDGGLLDMLIDAKANRASVKWQNYASRIVMEKAHLFLIKSGKDRKDYGADLALFNWAEFFEKNEAGQFLEDLREDWRSDFDFVFIDSRTGFTDTNGICTYFLPDVLVPVFTCTEQSLYGAKEMVIAAQEFRQRLLFDREALTIFPIASRFDSRSEYDLGQNWLTKFAEELHPFYNSWLPSSVSKTVTSPREESNAAKERIAEVRSVIERTKLPYVAYFSFGEKLPVLEESKDDPEGLSHAYLTVTNILDDRFVNVGNAISPSRTSPIVPGLGWLPADWREISNAPLSRIATPADRLVWATARAEIGDFAAAREGFASFGNDEYRNPRFLYEYAWTLYADPSGDEAEKILNLAQRALRLVNRNSAPDKWLVLSIKDLLTALMLYGIGGSYDSAIYMTNDILENFGSTASPNTRFHRACAFGQLFHAETIGGKRKLAADDFEAVKSIVIHDVRTILHFGQEYHDQLRMVAGPYRDEYSQDDDLQTFASVDHELCSILGIDRPKPSRRKVKRVKLSGDGSGRSGIRVLADESPR